MGYDRSGPSRRIDRQYSATFTDLQRVKYRFFIFFISLLQTRPVFLGNSRRGRARGRLEGRLRQPKEADSYIIFVTTKPRGLGAGGCRIAQKLGNKFIRMISDEHFVW